MDYGDKPPKSAGALAGVGRKGKGHLVHAETRRRGEKTFVIPAQAGIQFYRFQEYLKMTES